MSAGKHAHEPAFEARKPYGVYAAVCTGCGKELVADVEAWKAEHGIDPHALSEVVLEQIAASA